MREFAEQEIILPSGPFQDERFRIDRQPWVGLWFGAVDSGYFRRFALAGVGQGGKTLAGSTIPVMYHLFECRDTVVYGAPTLDMAADKWKQDVLPAILASRYRDLLPTSGRGSKGGTPTSLQFQHGPTLRFMTGGGSDKVRAGFTARAAVITEVDGLDEAGETSRETDKANQIEARTNAFGDMARIYLECTVSTEEGRIWREIKNGTDSRIVMSCPHCQRWSEFEREQLTGWQDAASVNEARERAALVCPRCAVIISDSEREQMNRLAKLCHRGQEVTEDGMIVGMMPKTLTLGFRFNAVHNLLVKMPRVAEEEFAAPRTTDPELAEKKLRQFYWTIPSEPEAITISEIDSQAIAGRKIDVPRGRIPADTIKITIGVDIGKWLCHWVAVAWRGDGTPHIPEYGRLEVPSQSLAEEVAILTALRKFRDEVCLVGWPSIKPDTTIKPSLVFVDSGNWESTAVTFCKESGAGFLPTKGFGIQQIGRRKTMHDPGYEVVRQPAGHNLVEINADHWKSYVHARLQTPAGQPGGLTLFHATQVEHLSFGKHLTAEKKVEEFIAGRGLVSRWEAISRNNHFLDALMQACAAGHAIGERIVQPEAKPSTAPPPKEAEAASSYLHRGRNKW